MRGNCDPLLHALTPLRLALPRTVTVFSRPTLLGDALWAPYGTSGAQLIAATDAAGAEGTDLAAIFCHADIVGGLMNEGAAASVGLRADVFPKGVQARAVMTARRRPCDRHETAMTPS